MDLEQLEKQRALLGLPSYVEQLKRQQAGQTPVTPLEVLGALTRPLESVTAAPARAAVAKLQQSAPLSEVVQAFKAQMGKPPETAPSGEQLAQATGLGGKPAKVAGLGLEMAIDPTNLIGAGVAKAAVPLLGLAGVVNKIKQGEKIAEAASVAAKPSSLGFYSKLEDEILKKMGGSATPEQVMAIAKGAKEEEVATSGLAELLKGKEKVTQEEVLQTIRENRPQLQEVVKGNTAEQMKLKQLQNNLKEAETDFFLAANKEGIKHRDAVDMLITMNASRNRQEVDEAATLFQSLPETLKPLARRFNELYAERDVVNQAARKSAKPELTPKFAKYQEPGGENYREVLLTLPERSAVGGIQVKPGRIQGEWDVVDERGRAIYTGTSPEEASEYIQELNYVRNKDLKTNQKNFYSGHWDEPNVLAHARVNDRVDEAGKKLFHVEEIQSDWHQKGRKAGYQGASDKALKELYAQRKSLEQKMDELGKNLRSNSPRSDAKAEFDAAKSEWDRLGSEILKIKFKDASSVVPDAPFKKSWMELMAKRMVTQAVESGADRLSWTPGAKQAARYDLSKQVRSISVGKNPDGTFEYVAVGHHGNAVQRGTSVPKEKLQDAIGKDLAQKAIDSKETWTDFEGLDLRLGGEGMKGFYDKILPDFLRKFGKKYGAEVGETVIPTNPLYTKEDMANITPDKIQLMLEKNEAMKVPYLELTPKLKEAVLKEGVPLFAAGAIALPAVVERMRQQEREKAVGR